MLTKVAVNSLFFRQARPTGDRRLAAWRVCPEQPFLILRRRRIGGQGKLATFQPLPSFKEARTIRSRRHVIPIAKK